MTGVKADVIRTFGTVFEDVSCEQVASKTLRAAFTWGGVAALFVDEAGTARAVCVGTPECDRRMRYQVAHLVGVYTCTCNSGGANRDARKRHSAIMMLPGWEKSNGAQLELHIAHRLGIDVIVSHADLLRYAGVL